MCALQTHKEADGNPPLLLYVLIRVWKSTMFNYWLDRMPSPPSCTTPLSLSLSSLPPFLPLPRSSPLVTLLVSSRKFSLQTDSALQQLCICVFTLPLVCIVMFGLWSSDNLVMCPTVLTPLCNPIWTTSVCVRVCERLSHGSSVYNRVDVIRIQTAKRHCCCHV